MARSPVRLLGFIGLMLVVLLATLGSALSDARRDSQSDLEAAFSDRAKVAGAMVSSLVSESISQARAADGERIGRLDHLTPAAVRTGTHGFPGSVVVLDGHARVMTASPGSGVRPGARLHGIDDATRPVLEDGAPGAISLGPGPDDVSMATNVSSPSGARVVVHIMPSAVLGIYFGSYLRQVRTGEGDEAYVVDGQRRLLAGTPGVSSDEARSDRNGRFERDGVPMFTARAPVGDQGWAVVVATPQSRLYAPIRGAGARVTWLLFTAFALLGLIVVLLVRRLSTAATDLGRANRELASRNAEVEAANRMKSDFLATMSHELRTPLNGIIGFTELMYDGRLGPLADNHREVLGDVLTSSNHLRRLIDDVLDLSKIEAGKMDVRPESVECCAVVREVCDVVRAMAVGKNIALTIDCDAEIGEVDVDPGKLKQVLFNYVANAIKFTPEGGHVAVRATLEPGDRFRITVEDDGPGIPPQDLDRLWLAFEQLESGSTRRHGGTGLGLSLTRRIVEAMDGEVGVDSVVGQGTRFHVVLPLRGAVAPSDAAPALAVG